LPLVQPLYISYFGTPIRASHPPFFASQFKTEFQPTMQSMKGKAATAAAAAKEAEGHTSAGGSMGGSERLARLSLYSTPPGHDVALEDFERSAIDRLRGT
jgi:hypothetical protein